jgi:hypothetical protein
MMFIMARFVFRFLFLISIAISIIGISSPVTAQIDKDDLIRVYSDLADNPVFIEKALQNYKVPTKIHPLFSEHLSTLMSDSRVIEFLATETLTVLSSTEAMDKTTAEKFYRNFGITLMQSKVASGVGRLPASDQRVIYEIVMVMFSNITSEECAALVNGTLDANSLAILELQTVSTFEDEEIRKYLSILRQALIAEITDDGISSLAKSELEVAETVFEAAFVDAILSNEISDRLIFAANNMTHAPNEDVCNVSKLSISTALGIEGTVGDWVIRMLSEQE